MTYLFMLKDCRNAHSVVKHSLQLHTVYAEGCRTPIDGNRPGSTLFIGQGIREGTAGGTELRGVMICVIPCYAVLCRVMPEMPT